MLSICSCVLFCSLVFGFICFLVVLVFSFFFCCCLCFLAVLLLFAFWCLCYIVCACFCSSFLFSWFYLFCHAVLCAPLFLVFTCASFFRPRPKGGIQRGAGLYKPPAPGPLGIPGESLWDSLGIPRGPGAGGLYKTAPL